MFPVKQAQITFASGGQPIRMDGYTPGDHGQRFPAVIALYGSGGGFSGMSEPAGLLASQGFAVYVLHYFDRTGTTFADKQTIFRHFPIWVKTLWDAISQVEREPTIDPQRIGLLGFSLGAYLSLSDAAIDKRVQAVVEFFGGLPKEMKLFMRRLCPVLILHGEADPTVPVEEAYHLQKVLEKKGIPYEMKIYPGAGHGFSGDVWHDAGMRTLSFLKKYLGSDHVGRPHPG
jgi:carboxymethylenebutenolidase